MYVVHTLPYTSAKKHSLSLVRRSTILGSIDDWTLKFKKANKYELTEYPHNDTHTLQTTPKTMWCEQGFRDLSQFYKMLPDFPVNLALQFMNLGLEFSGDQPGMKFPEETFDLFSEVGFLSFLPYISGGSSNAFPMAYLNPENRAKALKIISRKFAK